MGTSFVEFRGSGFWIRDWKLELLLFVVLQEDARDQRLARAAPELAEKWAIHAHNAFNGSHDVYLNEFADAPETHAIILELLARIATRSDTLPRRVLEGAGVGAWNGVAHWERDMSVTVLHGAARQLARLVRGEISSQPGDPGALNWEGGPADVE